MKYELLAQWLENTHLESLKVSLNAKMLKNAGFTIDDHKKWAWLLTARELQKKQRKELVELCHQSYELGLNNGKLYEFQKLLKSHFEDEK